MNRRRFTIGVATPSGMSAPYAYFTPAVALGYDRDEGLEFAFFYGGEPGSTARSLCQEACDVACLNTIVGFMGRAEGLPMLAIGSKARRAHRYFVVMPESPVEKLSDLDGKMIACDFPHIQPLAEAALAEEGVAPDQFEWAPWHGSGMQIRDMIEPMRHEELDAAFIMDWTDGDAIARGLKLRHLRSKLLERIRVSSCYWTTETKFADDEEVLRALCAPSRRASCSRSPTRKQLSKRCGRHIPRRNRQLACVMRCCDTTWRFSKPASNLCGSTSKIPTLAGAQFQLKK